MSNPSSRSHLYRLGAVLVLGFVGFLALKAIATPASWDFEHWYRGDAKTEIASAPLVYGGNESCQECHADQLKELNELKHKTVSCESCHGALADHVRNGEKTAAARVDDDSNWQCLNCHEALISRKLVDNRPDFPLFKVDRVPEHEEVAKGALCMVCHNPHDPAP